MRISETDPSGLSPEQKKIYDRITAGPRGQVRGPYHAYLLHPGVCEGVERMGHFLRFAATLSGNLRELAILTVGRHWKAEFEWFAHAPIAIREGLAEDTIEAIRVGTAPTFSNDEEAAVHGFVCSLLETGRINDDVYSDMKSRLGEDGIVELIGIVGHYTGVAMTLNSFEIVPPEGERPEFS
ncbi:MAG: 4-carboxymuconolactone decarboxylase [Alphaproteobacteria bacterium]|nr:4-carboxymuconolactone decarboxylase [Alphaproteobacteria bacterium]HCP00233.1 4-carboxymuconolactone decarboxylase [Rhodospirillaceae bacterium]